MKKTICISVALLLCIIMCFSLLSCSTSVKKYSDTVFDVFDSFATLTVYESSKNDYEVYLEVFKSKLETYHRMLDIYNEYEGTVNLCTLNKNAASSHVEVSSSLLEFLEYSVRMHTLTDGYTSIALGALTSVWKTAISDGTLPEQSVIDEAALHTDISCMELELITKTVHFTDSSLQLDAGALAKGYVTREISNALIEAGCESFLVDIGGTVCGFGQKRGNTNWYSGIQSPDGDGELGISINVSGYSLSTSGSYHRKATIDGTLYHHIVNPFTKKPENNFTSVSVICSSAAEADALSTALFSMTLKEGKELSERLDFEAVWVSFDGSITTTDGINIE